MLMGSSAQNSSGVHWCRCRVRFNKVPEKVWEALVQSQLTFNRVLEKVAKKGWVALVQPGQVQQGFGEGLGGFAIQCQVQQGSGEGSGKCGRVWCRARSGLTGFRRRFRKRFREALVQSQVRFNRICVHLILGNIAEVLPALGLAARFRFFL